MLSRVCDECLPYWPPGATTLTVVNIPVIIPSTCDHCGSYGPVVLMEPTIEHINPEDLHETILPPV